MKTLKSMVLLSLTLLAGQAFGETVCRYSLRGDFTAAIRRGGDPTDRAISQLSNPTACANKKICSGVMECETGGKIAYTDVQCAADNYGNCPAPSDCEAASKSKPPQTTSKKAKYVGQGKPVALAVEDTDPSVGAECGRVNNDLGARDCMNFCKARCQKFLASAPDKVADCVSQINCEAPRRQTGGR